MMRMSRPRKVFDDGLITWWDDPTMIDRLGQYCDRDVEVEYLADKKLLPLSPEERELWELDQKINDRGVALDVETIRRAVGVLEVARERADARMCDLTGGAVQKCTEPLRIIAWLQGRGFSLDSISKDTHADLLAMAGLFGDETAADVIKLRQGVKTSTAKFDAMLDTVCADGRARGLFNYHRASTGRWSGAAVQPQNLPRVDEEKELPSVLAAIQIMMEVS